MKEGRLDRQRFLGETSEKTLSAVRVGLVGLGGGGSHFAQQLAHLGVRHFMLFDPQKIALSNLNRLVGGTLEDVKNGVSKVAIAARLIRSIEPEADIVEKTKLWQEEVPLLRGCDVIFGAVDTFRARDELERFARRFLIPYIDIGMDVHEVEDNQYITGQAVLSLPGSPCLRCLNLITDKNIADEAAEYGTRTRSQLVWPNGLLASAGVGMFTQLMTPWPGAPSPPLCLELDGNMLSIMESSRTRHAGELRCPHYKIDELGDPLFLMNG